MRFSDLVADKDFIHDLVSMADRGMLGHALLLHENEGGGGLAIAVALAQYLMCRDSAQGDSCGVCSSCHKAASLVHPDLHFAFPVNTGNLTGSDKKPTSETYLKYWRELYAANPYFDEQQLYAKLEIDSKSGVISVAEAKRIIERLNLTALEGDTKVMIIWLPERMNTEAANKLLKVLEEPYPGTLFILVTQAPEKIISTIVSRCRLLRVPPVGNETIRQALEKVFDVPSEEIDQAVAYAAGSYGRAFSYLGGSSAQESYSELIYDLLEASVAKNLMEVINVSERMAQLASREKMKTLCVQALSVIRNIYMIQLGMDAIAHIPPAEKDFVENIARKAAPGFCLRISEHIDRAYMLIDRNVSAKILFCDLADRFYAYI